MVKQLITNKLIIISLILTFLAGFANGVMDTLQFHYPESVFADYDNQEFWNPDISDRNKYATDNFNRLTSAPDNLYYKLADLKYKEAFPLSATLFVSLTDGWHLTKLINNWLIMIVIAMLLVNPLLGFTQLNWWKKLKIAVLIFAVFNIFEGAGFHLIYTIIN